MRKKILLLLLILLLLIIWGHSLTPRSVSSRESGLFTELLYPLLALFVGEEAVTDHLVRKLAHFTEFFALGLVLGLLVHQERKPGLPSFLFCVVMGQLAAFLDESIQILSGRGDRILDVWLDVSGAVSGILLALLFLRLRRRKDRPPDRV